MYCFVQNLICAETDQRKSKDV